MGSRVYNPWRIRRDWGTYEVLVEEDNYVVKRLIFKPNGVMNNQRHSGRSEHWFLVEGEIVFNGKIYQAPASWDVPVGSWHRAENISKEDAVVIETWTGQLLSEDDIERESK